MGSKFQTFCKRHKWEPIRNCVCVSPPLQRWRRGRRDGIFRYALYACASCMHATGEITSPFELSERSRRKMIPCENLVGLHKCRPKKKGFILPSAPSLSVQTSSVTVTPSGQVKSVTVSRYLLTMTLFGNMGFTKAVTVSGYHCNWRHCNQKCLD